MVLLTGLVAAPIFCWNPTRDPDAVETDNDVEAMKHSGHFITAKFHAGTIILAPAILMLALSTGAAAALPEHFPNTSVMAHAYSRF